MRGFIIFAIVAFFALTVYGCEDENAERDADRVSEEVARDIERDLDRELERAEEQIEHLREELEERFEDEMSEEDIERMSREIEESVSTGVARVGELLEDIGQRFQEDSAVEVVDYVEFEQLLPERIEGMRRVDMDGANKNALGIRFSKLEAEYESDDAELEMAVLDMGTMKGLVQMGFDFLDEEINEEDRNGFERTRKFSGFPGFESVEYDDDEVEIKGIVIVDRRFVVVVAAEGEGLSKDLAEDIFDDFPFRRLRRLGE